MIQRCRAQETGQDRKIHLCAIWKVGGVTGGGEIDGQGEVGSPEDHLHFRDPEKETEKPWADGQNENRESHVKSKEGMCFRERAIDGTNATEK